MYKKYESSSGGRSKNTEEFMVKKGLRQGSALSPFFFLIVMAYWSLYCTTGKGFSENMFCRWTWRTAKLWEVEGSRSTWTWKWAEWSCSIKSASSTWRHSDRRRAKWYKLQLGPRERWPECYRTQKNEQRNQKESVDSMCPTSPVPDVRNWDYGAD